MSWCGYRRTLGNEIPVSELPVLQGTARFSTLFYWLPPLEDIGKDEGNIQSVSSLSVQVPLRMITGTHTLTKTLTHIWDGWIRPGYHPLSCIGLPNGHNGVLGWHVSSNLLGIWLQCTRKLGSPPPNPQHQETFEEQEARVDKETTLKPLFHLQITQSCLLHH